MTVALLVPALPRPTCYNYGLLEDGGMDADGGPLLLEPDALEAGRNPESITNGAGLSLGTGNLK